MSPTLGDWLLLSAIFAIIATAFGYLAWDSLRTVDWTPPELEAMRRREEAAREILNRRDDRRVGTERRSVG